MLIAAKEQYNLRATEEFMRVLATMARSSGVSKAEILCASVLKVKAEAERRSLLADQGKAGWETLLSPEP